MSESEPVAWSFLTNHARVLICIARDPGVRLREIGEVVGITERAAHRIVRELVDAGYVTRRRTGRRNQYAIRSDLPVPDALARNSRVGELLAILSAAPTRSSGRDRAMADAETEHLPQPPETVPPAPFV